MERTVKERACLYALRHGVALYIHGREVHGIFRDGSSVVICRWHSLDDVWHRALSVLVRRTELLLDPPPRYRVETPSGVYEAASVMQLLWKWFRGRHTLQGIFDVQG